MATLRQALPEICMSCCMAQLALLSQRSFHSHGTCELLKSQPQDMADVKQHKRCALSYSSFVKCTQGEGCLAAGV